MFPRKMQDGVMSLFGVMEAPLVRVVTHLKSPQDTQGAERVGEKNILSLLLQIEK